jgi:hypothetical protein
LAIIITTEQAKLVATKQRKPDARPKYYNANTQQQVAASADFEAFLILLGGQRSGEAINWTKKAAAMGSNDADRDALVAALLQNESDTANWKYIEMRPIVRSFEQFRTTFSLTGFESVPEPGMFLADVQLAMAEIKLSGDRWNSHKLWADTLLEQLSNRGITMARKRQLNSWFNCFTAY